VNLESNSVHGGSLEITSKILFKEIFKYISISAQFFGFLLKLLNEQDSLISANIWLEVFGTY